MSKSVGRKIWNFRINFCFNIIPASSSEQQQLSIDQEILQFYERKISVKNGKIYDLKNADHFFCVAKSSIF